MTIQPTEAPAIDLELLVGEMPEVPCENEAHGVHEYGFHDHGAATHYAHVNCRRCGHTVTKAYCAAFTLAIARNEILACDNCWTETPAREIVTILGPVKQ